MTTPRTFLSAALSALALSVAIGIAPPVGAVAPASAATGVVQQASPSTGERKGPHGLTKREKRLSKAKRCGKRKWHRTPARCHRIKVAKAKAARLKRSETRGATPQAVTTVRRPTARPAAITGTPWLYRGGADWAAYQRETDPAARADYYNIAITPQAFWFGPSIDFAALAKLVQTAAAENVVPQLVFYAMPFRDCGGYSSGGVADLASYKSWVDRSVAAIGNARAVVIIEPDAISFCDNNPTVRALRTEALSYAAKALHDRAPNVAAYIHAGSGELPYAWAVKALEESGVAWVRGVAMNVAHHRSTAVEEAYADGLMDRLAAAGLPGKHYVVDTSRNGIGLQPNPGRTFDACNNPNAALGTRPTTQTTGRYADAYLWIKRPGESDGQCGAGEPMSGWAGALARNLAGHARTYGSVALVAAP